MEAHAGDIIKKRLMSFAFEKTPCISLSYKLVSVWHREYEYGLFSSRRQEGHLQFLDLSYDWENNFILFD